MDAASEARSSRGTVRLKETDMRQYFTTTQRGWITTLMVIIFGFIGLLCETSKGEQLISDVQFTGIALGALAAFLGWKRLEKKDELENTGLE